MNAPVRDIHQVESWPEEHQEALAELSREIEARRTGVNQLTDDERRVIADPPPSKLRTRLGLALRALSLRRFDLLRSRSHPHTLYKSIHDSFGAPFRGEFKLAEN